MSTRLTGVVFVCLFCLVVVTVADVAVEPDESRHAEGHAPGENVPPKRRKLNRDVTEDAINAIVRGQFDTLKKLVEEDGADVDGTDVYSVSMLHMCSIKCKPDMLQFLLDKGANVNAKLTNVAGHRAGETPLHFAVSSRQLECVKLLIEGGAGIDVAAREGLTPIHIAAGIGFPDILQIFMNLGADFNVPASNSYGSLPIHLAVTSGDLKSVKLLIDNGADVKAPNKLNSTCLHGAAAIGDVEIMKLLLSNGADPDAKNHEMKTPLDVAKHRSKQSVEVQNNLKEITKLLLGLPDGEGAGATQEDDDSGFGEDGGDESSEL